MTSNSKPRTDKKHKKHRKIITYSFPEVSKIMNTCE